MKPCHRTAVTFRRVSRNPIVQRAVRSGARMQKSLVKNTILSIVPSAINDVAIHHAPVNIAEALHITIDTMTIGSLSAVASILMAVAKIV